MHKNKAIRYAKVLIFFSFLFILIGLFFSFRDSFTSVESVDVIVSPDEGDSSVISVTTINGNELVTDNAGNSEIPNNSDITEQGEKVQQQVVDSNDLLADLNNSLRKEIENQYNVSIYYGKETDGYMVSGILTTPILDSNIVNSQLTRLKNTLDLYPNGLFREIRDGGIPLTIYLVSSYSENSVTGITDSSYNYAHISIAAIYPFEESFYHESYHYIERYMFKIGVNFNSWDSLNPDGFSYGSVYNKYSYVNTFLDSAPFVNNYAQSSDAEDRASTFEYMMASSKASCLNKGMVVWQKASFIAKTMEASLTSVSPNVVEYWERFL